MRIVEYRCLYLLEACPDTYPCVDRVTMFPLFGTFAQLLRYELCICMSIDDEGLSSDAILSIVIP